MRRLATLELVIVSALVESISVPAKYDLTAVPETPSEAPANVTAMPAHDVPLNVGFIEGLLLFIPATVHENAPLVAFVVVTPLAVVDPIANPS